jgi:hypothetical protein
MKRKWSVGIVACVLTAVVWALVGRSRLDPTPPVTLTLQTVSLTSDSKPVALFAVTNAGSKPVSVSFDTKDYQEKGQWRSLRLPVAGVFGFCSVGPRTNCTVQVSGPSRPGPWRVHATVFEPSSTSEKVRFAARRLWMRVSGKADFKKFWFANTRSPAYEITSPEVPELIRPAAPLEFPLGVTEAEDAGLGPSGLDWLADPLKSIDVPRFAPPLAPPPDGPATRLGNQARSGEGRGR